MADFVEGRNAVLEALRSGRGVARVFVASGVRPHPTLREIGRLADEASVEVREVARSELDDMSSRGAHQGVVAVVESYRYASLDDVLDGGAERETSLVVVLDHVVDPGNLGAVIRSAEALGADGLVIPKARSASVGPVVLKVAAGAAEYLPIARVPNVVRALEKLKAAGYWVAGASERGESPAWEAPLDGRIALVLGSEGRGLSHLVEETCDFLVRIPLTGRTGSLNVAQAATVLAYEWARRAGHVR